MPARDSALKSCSMKIVSCSGMAHASRRRIWLGTDLAEVAAEDVISKGGEIGWPALDNLPVAEDIDAVGDGDDKLHELFGEEHCRMPLLDDQRDRRRQLLDHHRSQTKRRLVQH